MKRVWDFIKFYCARNYDEILFLAWVFMFFGLLFYDGWWAALYIAASAVILLIWSLSLVIYISIKEEWNNFNDR